LAEAVAVVLVDQEIMRLLSTLLVMAEVAD
jgi:hypothetical protein